MSHFSAVVAATFALTSIATCHAQSPAAATTIVHGKVVAYGSGTAFAILDGDEKLHRIKLTGVDAPERRQRFAPQARQLASEWLGRSVVEIMVDRRGNESRIHGRAHVEGRDLALTLIDAGLAWCDPSDGNLAPAAVWASYKGACERAIRDRRGLWQDANPVPPWEYRKIPEFDPPRSPQQQSERTCRDIGYRTSQCDDGTRYRAVGDDIHGSDGSRYARRGRTLTGNDGNNYEQQGNSTYGSDGTVCRTRGRQTVCY